MPACWTGTMTLKPWINTGLMKSMRAMAYHSNGFTNLDHILTDGAFGCLDGMERKCSSFKLFGGCCCRRGAYRRCRGGDRFLRSKLWEKGIQKFSENAFCGRTGSRGCDCNGWGRILPVHDGVIVNHSLNPLLLGLLLCRFLLHSICLCTHLSR